MHNIVTMWQVVSIDALQKDGLTHFRCVFTLASMSFDVTTSHFFHTYIVFSAQAAVRDGHGALLAHVSV